MQCPAVLFKRTANVRAFAPNRHLNLPESNMVLVSITTVPPCTGPKLGAIANSAVVLSYTNGTFPSKSLPLVLTAAEHLRTNCTGGTMHFTAELDR